MRYELSSESKEAAITGTARDIAQRISPTFAQLEPGPAGTDINLFIVEKTSGQIRRLGQEIL
jgi:hypothetical protein